MVCLPSDFPNDCNVYKVLKQVMVIYSIPANLRKENTRKRTNEMELHEAYKGNNSNNSSYIVTITTRDLLALFVVII